jgi:hypothetical protein
MNKDVIYIDVEDDITAIIGKIKASSEKIVALVPPKRVGILQSAVNLRLLDRMASNSHKKLVIITNNAALAGLTAAAGIPIAKNLQTKPEIAAIAALSVDDADDIIDGSKLPVGELEKTADLVKVKDASVDDAIDTIDIDDTAVSTAAVGAAAVKSSRNSGKKSGVKVPNFNAFRKRLFLGIFGFILLVAFIIWANVAAPGATIIITAKTNAAPISTTVTLSGATPTDVSKGTIQTVTQTLKKDMSVKFTPTGQQDIGIKATGTMTLTGNSLSGEDIIVPAGTKFTSADNHVFTSNSAVTVKATYLKGGPVYDTEQVGVTAIAPGPDYNLASQSYQTDQSGYSAHGSTMAGGTTNVQTVVSNSDIATATTALNALSTDDDKKALIAQFVNGESVITDSFNVARAAPVSSPAVGAQASGQATLISNFTYTIVGVPKSDIELFLKDALNKQLSGTTDQRIYDDGIDKVVLAGYNVSGTTATINIAASGQIGPNINTDDIKKQSKGKKSGEVQANISSISGVSNVQVNFSYFWVTTVPNDTSKVDVQFKLTNG